MAKNKLSDLNDHLFLAIERLNQEDLTPEQIEIETKRASVVSNLVGRGVDIARVALDGIKAKSNFIDANTELPEMFKSNLPKKLEVK